MILKSAARHSRAIIIGAVASMIIGGIAMAVPSAKAAAAPAAVVMSCPKGDKLIAPTAHTTDALGVTRYTYRALPGFVSMVPSSGLTASQITPAVVKDLGVLQSAKPITMRMRQDIARESRTPSWFCLTAALPGTIRSAGKQSAPGEISPQALSGSPNPSASYAGYAVTSNEFNGSPINSIEGDFPVSTAPVPAVNSQTSVWIGVGDFSQETSLVQAGILTRTISGSRTFTPFLEYIDVGSGCCAMIAGSSDVSSGNEVEVEVYWTSDTNTCFFVYDKSTGAYPVDSCITVADYGVQHDTSSAEWLMEDAIPQKSPEEYFENLGQVPWTSVAFSEGAESDPNWHSPFAYYYDEYEIVAQAGKIYVPTCKAGSGPNGVLAYPANPAGTSSAGTFDSNTNSVDGCTSGLHGCTSGLLSSDTRRARAQRLGPCPLPLPCRQLSWGAPEAPVMPGALMMPGTPVMPVAPVAPLALSAGSYTHTRSRPVFFAR